MRSRELGLVLAQHLLGVEDMHYGLWDADLESFRTYRLPLYRLP